MPHPKDREPYTYRDDPKMAAFDDSAPIFFMDGECALCTIGARIIAKLDREKEFRICPVQSDLGVSVLTHYGIDPRDPDSWLFLSDGTASGSLDAVIKVGQRLGGIGHVLSIFLILPSAWRDWIYRRIARNRYRLFGRTQMCAVPDPELRRRLMQ